VPLKVSTSGAAKIISSTPKPDRVAQSSSNSFISLGLSRSGLAGADSRAVDRAVDPVEGDFQPARTDARLLELPAEGGQQADRRGDISDRVGSTKASRVRKAGAGRALDRLGQRAQRLVERMSGCSPPRRASGARAGIEIADAAQPEFRRFPGSAPAAASTAAPERGALAVVRAVEVGLALGKARQRPGGARTVGGARQVRSWRTGARPGRPAARARPPRPGRRDGRSRSRRAAGRHRRRSRGAAGRSLGDGAAQRVDRHPGQRRTTGRSRSGKVACGPLAVSRPQSPVARRMPPHGSAVRRED
jgi:hypothetical protein